MSKAPVFLEQLRQSSAEQLKDLYFEHRDDFVKWGRKKYFSSEDDKREPVAVGAYQRALALLRFQGKELDASEHKSVERLLQAIGREFAINEGLETGNTALTGFDFYAFDASPMVAMPTEAPAVEQSEGLSAEQMAQIDRFLAGELEGDELSRFKVDLAYDQAVADEVERRNLKAREDLRSNTGQFISQLKAFEQEWPYGEKRPSADQPKKEKPAKPAKKKSSKKKPAKKKRTPALIFGSLLGVAVLFAMLIVIGVASGEPEDDPTGLYLENFKALSDDYITSREDVPRDLEEGINSFSHGDFSGAIQPLEVYVDAEQNDREARLYLAISLLANNEEEAALKHLRIVEDVSKPDALQYHALWYRGLSYLREGEKGKAKSVFRKLQFSNAPGADYRAESRRILEKLD